MQGQRGAIGSFPETLAFDHGSTSNDVVNSPSDRLPDYISLNLTDQEGHSVSMWDVGEPSSSSGPNQLNESDIEPRPDYGWSSLMKSCPEPPSSVLSLGDHDASSPSCSGPFGPPSDPFDIDDHRLSHKRKAVELTMSQSSSGVGSSNMIQRHEGDPTIPRLGLSVGETALAARQQVDSLLTYNNNEESGVSGLQLNQQSENSSSHQGPRVLQVPALRRNFQSTSRWNRHSISRATRSPILVIPGDHDELDLLPNHPVYPPPSNINTTAPTDLNRSSTAGDGNVNDSGHENTSSSRARQSSGPSLSYNPRRPSAFLRRALLTTAGSEGNGGQNGNILPTMTPALSSSSSSTLDVGTLPGHRHQLYSRSSVLLGRHLESAYLLRTMAPGSDGRGRLVSEIRNVLDLMRRGESLRIEDAMLFDQSVLYGIADIHDRHRDMRLDIDNMSYEDLLALEERIGNVNTGLTEETISKHLKQKPYVVATVQPNVEPCCVCQEEYKDGDDLGTLECGHDFHHGCIKEWLQHKNLCPVCKSTGFTAT